jgi:pilus assembly protein CpaC
MLPVPPIPGRRLPFAGWGPLVALVLCGFGAGSVAAPPCPGPNTISGFAPCQPPAPEKPPRPPEGPESVPAFVAGLSSTDSAFEVVLGQGRILTTKENLAGPPGKGALLAVGDPTVIDFVIVSPRQIRLTGKRLGVTDLSITTADDRTYTFEVRVVADLHVLRGQLQCIFPDASLRLGQIRDHIVVEGQARDTAQVARILETIRAYLLSVRASEVTGAANQLASPPPAAAPRPGDGPAPPPRPGAAPPDEEVQPVKLQVGPGPLLPGPREPALAEAAAAGFVVSPELGRVAAAEATLAEPRIINLIRIPTSQQVLLKVRVAELNRTALREVGADLVWVDSDTGTLLGSQLGGGSVRASGIVGANGGLLTNRNPLRTFFDTSPQTTVFGIFEGANFEGLLRVLRRNSLLKILAEPNLVAMHGQEANFLAGGEFPVPVPQTITGGVGTSVTVLFKQFGVRLAFVPFLQDGDVIRLTVDPEVSSIDFAIGTVIVPGGSPVPGLNTRRAHTTVEMRQGQTLAIAGLLQLTLDGQTSRIPGLGDLPILGPFFSNTTSNRIEKELIVLVTPYLIEPNNPDQVPPSPGDEVNGPNDLEFYLLNRIEGRTGVDARATTNYDDPCYLLRCLMGLHHSHVQGPHGFTD